MNFDPRSLSNVWSLCYTATYALPMNSSVTTSVLTNCNKTKLLLGCRPVCNTTLNVAAMGNRSDVLYNCSTTSSCVYTANGVGWYYSNFYSWGFARGGDPVNRYSCDVDSTNPSYRLCWHTHGSYGGYRCGSRLGLNSATDWEKVIYHSD